VNVWDIEDLTKPVVQYKTKSEINDIKFNPGEQWLAAATNKGICIWDLNIQGSEDKKSLLSELTH